VIGAHADVHSTLIPFPEIHTARMRVDSIAHFSPAERQNLHEEFAASVAGLRTEYDLIGQISPPSFQMPLLKSKSFCLDR
jgi:hypothetical protein